MVEVGRRRAVAGQEDLLIEIAAGLAGGAADVVRDGPVETVG
jgi:hypothetical protein